MLIEEIVRSCVHESVADAAVACIGLKFASEVRDAAASYGMSTGAFVALSVGRFARHGDEAELRAVRCAMQGAQEPVLAGLHRILCIMLAAGVRSDAAPRKDRYPRGRPATIEQMDIAARGDFCCC